MFRNPEQVVQANINYLANTPAEELVAWMLKDMSLTPIWYNDDRNARVRLIETIIVAAPEVQIDIKAATTAAINSWSLEIHGAEILHNLAFVAGMTGNIDALPALIRIVDETSIEGVGEELIDAYGVTVAVVQGFAPDALARDALERWWADPNFDWRHTQQLFLGLLACEPDRAEGYLWEFFQRFAEHSDYFVLGFLGYITSEAAIFVGADQLEEILSRSDNEIARQMLAAMPVAREIIEETKKKSSS